MKLVNSEIGISLDLEENMVYVLSIENSLCYRNIIAGLIDGIHGKECTWVLSDQNEENDLAKDMDIIIDPWNLNFNSARIKKQLLSYLTNLIIDERLEDLSRIRTNLCQFIEKVASVSDFPLDYDDEIDFADIFKICDLKIDLERTDFLDNLVNYIKLEHNLCKVRIIVIVNCKAFLSADEIDLLYKEVFYNKAYLILIETKQYEKHNNEKNVIIDKDMCIITF